MTPGEATRFIRATAAAESVIYPEDFFLRRTNWRFSPPQPAALERLVANALHAPAEAAPVGDGITVLSTAQRQ
jgi:hypothetical protein